MQLIRTHIFYERRLDHESIMESLESILSIIEREGGRRLSMRRLWAKILWVEPLFSCLGLSFEERFGNVAREREQVPTSGPHRIVVSSIK